MKCASDSVSIYGDTTDTRKRLSAPQCKYSTIYPPDAMHTVREIVAYLTDGLTRKVNSIYAVGQTTADEQSYGKRGYSVACCWAMPPTPAENPNPMANSAELAAESRLIIVVSIFCGGFFVLCIIGLVRKLILKMREPQPTEHSPFSTAACATPESGNNGKKNRKRKCRCICWRSNKVHPMQWHKNRFNKQ